MSVNLNAPARIVPRSWLSVFIMASLLSFIPFSTLARNSSRLDESGRVKVGDKAPLFGGQQLSGDVVTMKALLSQIQGKPGAVISLMFFATKCKSCKEGLLKVEASRSLFDSSGTVVLAVAVGDVRDELASYVQRNNLP